jgi:hypothetical protein
MPPDETAQAQAAQAPIVVPETVDTGKTKATKKKGRGCGGAAEACRQKEARGGLPHTAIIFDGSVQGTGYRDFI